jgi:hypothetical protein
LAESHLDEKTATETAATTARKTVTGNRECVLSMWYLFFKVAFVLFVWMMWYLLFGLECYMNGLLTRHSWALPFVGLRQDIDWILHPSHRPEGYPVLNYLHVLLLSPVVLACIY